MPSGVMLIALPASSKRATMLKTEMVEFALRPGEVDSVKQAARSQVPGASDGCKPIENPGRVPGPKLVGSAGRIRMSESLW
jgi:hypothetical protein